MRSEIGIEYIWRKGDSKSNDVVLLTSQTVKYSSCNSIQLLDMNQWRKTYGRVFCTCKYGFGTILNKGWTFNHVHKLGNGKLLQAEQEWLSRALHLQDLLLELWTKLLDNALKGTHFISPRLPAVIRSFIIKGNTWTCTSNQPLIFSPDAGKIVWNGLEEEGIRYWRSLNGK